MWPHYRTDSPLHAFLRSVHAVRKAHGLAYNGTFAATPATVAGASAAVLAFARGRLLVLLTNSQQTATLCVPLSALHPAWKGLCSGGGGGGGGGGGNSGKPKATTVLGRAPPPACATSGDKLCASTVGGEPSAFAPLLGRRGN
eukprot:SAG22_NODE_5313_length_1039_cov_1.534043_2_plen_143_part_00